MRKPFSWEEEFERLETLSDVSGCSKQDEAMIFPEDIAAITNLEDTVNQIIFEEVHIAKGWAFKLPEVNTKRFTARLTTLMGRNGISRLAHLSPSPILTAEHSVLCQIGGRWENLLVKCR